VPSRKDPAGFKTFAELLPAVRGHHLGDGLPPRAYRLYQPRSCRYRPSSYFFFALPRTCFYAKRALKRSNCGGLLRCDPYHGSGLPCGGNVPLEHVMEVQMLRTIKVMLVATMLVPGLASLSLGTVTTAQAYPASPVDPE
jgi:hypothetical protein